jgi:hypothetical protein
MADIPKAGKSGGMPAGGQRTLKGRVYLTCFRWMFALLITLVVGKGFQETISNSVVGTRELRLEFVGLVNIDFLRMTILFLAILAVLSYLLRYLFFSPFPIYSRVLLEGREAADRWEAVDNYVRPGPREETDDLSDSQIDERIYATSFWDIIISSLYLMAEFFLAYLIVQTIGKSALAFLLILLLPLLDVSMLALCLIGVLSVWVVFRSLLWMLRVVLGIVNGLNGFRKYFKRVFSRDRRGAHGFDGSLTSPEAMADHITALDRQAVDFAKNLVRPFFSKTFNFWIADLIDFTFPVTVLALLWGDLFRELTVAVTGGLSLLEVFVDRVAASPSETTAFLFAIIVGGLLASLTNVILGKRVYKNTVALLFRAGQ